MKKIFLTGKHAYRFAVVDDEDFKNLSKFRWYLNRKYALTFIKRKCKSMHGLILGKIEGMEIDHKNHDGLDNRKENIRFVTRQQNHMNRSVIRSSVGFKGVYERKDVPRKKKFKALLIRDRKTLNLGNYETAEEAAKVYDKKALELYGDYAFVNFPKSS